MLAAKARAVQLLWIDQAPYECTSPKGLVQLNESFNAAHIAEGRYNTLRLITEVPEIQSLYGMQL